MNKFQGASNTLTGHKEYSSQPNASAVKEGKKKKERENEGVKERERKGGRELREAGRNEPPYEVRRNKDNSSNEKLSLLH